MKELYNETSDKKTATVKEGKKLSVNFNQSYRVLVKPLITEKAASLNPDGKYVFAVANDANKISVAKAVEAVYGVKPMNINIINVRGKVVRSGRHYGKRKNWRKAIVTLPKGKSIQVYEGV